VALLRRVVSFRFRLIRFLSQVVLASGTGHWEPEYLPWLMLFPILVSFLALGDIFSVAIQSSRCSLGLQFGCRALPQFSVFTWTVDG
jgi:hypothetical protein